MNKMAKCALVLAMMIALVVLPTVAMAAEVYEVSTNADMQEAITKAVDGDTIKLTADIKDGYGIKIAANKYSVKGLTFDFGGYTYNFDSNAVGSTGTTTLGFQLLKGNKVTMKDGTLTSTAGSGIKRLIQSYCDLNLIDMTIDGSNLDEHSGDTPSPNLTISLNNGATVISGNTSIIQDDSKDYAFDVYDSDSYAGGTSAIVNTTGKIVGNIDVSGDDDDNTIAEMFVNNIDLEGMIGSENNAGSITISKGVFSSTPNSDYVSDDKTVVTIVNGKEGKCIIGDKNTVNSVVASVVTSSSQILVQQGDAILTNLPVGVSIDNIGGGKVSANGVEVVDSYLIMAPSADVPKTGDNSNIALYAALLTLSAAGMLLMRRRSAER